MEKYVAYAADTHEYDFFPTFEAAAQWLLGDDWSEGYSQELVDGECYIAEITHVSAVKITDSRKNYTNWPGRGEDWPYGKNVDWVGEPYMKKVEDDDRDRGTWFRSAITGMWYRSREAAGEIDGWKEDGVFHDLADSEAQNEN